MFGLMTRQAINREAKTAALMAAKQWESPFTIANRRADVGIVCNVKGIEYPASRHGVFPEMLRTQAPEWWGRQLKKADRRQVEALELKKGRITKYCSDLVLAARLEQKKQNRDLLEQMVAICETADGETIERDLIDLVKGSNANPAIRRAELMTRISGFEKYAKTKGQVPYFFTMTCPSRFHRNSQERWDGSTPKDANSYLCKVWAKTRAKIGRAGLQFFGFRIAEPHKDGCPHWHCLLWFNSHNEARQVAAIIKDYFLADSAGEPGAQRRRVTVERINHKKGSATGYIAKYICKNVDGIYSDNGTDQTFADKRRDENGNMVETGMGSDDAAARVDAWAACWGIRQFQQIGGPKVGAWRELRRLRDQEQTDSLEPFRAAAITGQWDLFCELDADHAAEFGARVRVWTETSLDKLERLNQETAGGLEAAADDDIKKCLNKWQEPALRTVQGIAYGRELKKKTRLIKWILMLKKAEASKAEEQRRHDRDFSRVFLQRITDARDETALAFSAWQNQAAAPPGSLDLYQ